MPRYDSLDAVAAASPLPDVVLLDCDALADAAPGDAPEAARQVAGRALETVRDWAADPRLSGVRLVLAADPYRPATATVWGLVRSAQIEHPGRFVVVGADPADRPASDDGAPASGAADATGATRAAQALLAPAARESVAAAAEAGEPQLLLRDGAVLAPRVARRTAGGAEPAGFGDGTVLVTGGLGGLGAVVARHLVEQHGVRHLLLTSRRGADTAGAAELAEELGRSGASVRIEACDAADRDALAALLASIPDDRPLTGVLHAAGVLDDGLLAGQSTERLAKVLRPKADAAWALHELTAGLPLRAFVLFSSVAGVLGNGGQATYGAANTFLDALAGLRRRAGLPAVSVAWGLWASSGMGTHLTAADEARLARAGIAPLSEEQGLRLLDTVLTDPDADPVVVASRWNLAAPGAGPAGGGSVPPLLRGLVRTGRRTAGGAGGAGQQSSGGGLALTVRSLDAGQAREAVAGAVRGHVAAVLGHGDPASLDGATPFIDLGLDSLTAVELRNRVQADTALDLAATLVFDHPTIDALAGHLTGLLVPEPPDPMDALEERLQQMANEFSSAAPALRERVIDALFATLDRLGVETDARTPAASLDGATDEELFAFIDAQS
jgi:short-subunit dehydrogenase/aryl carrier-like protein